MRIGAKISAGFAAMVILTGVLGLAGWIGLYRYAGSVTGADRMAAIADRVASANSDAVTFRATGDEVPVVRANSSLHEARQAADAIGATALSEAIHRFQLAFTDLVNLSGEVEGLSADMELAADRLEQLAVSVLHAERANYTEIAKARAEALDVQGVKLKGAQQAEALMRATLTARRLEAVFRSTNDPEHADNTRNAIKGMFLAALNLKRTAGDGPESEMAGTLANSVNTYRKAFDALAEAAPYTAAAEQAAADLDAVSDEIASLSNALARRQIESYETARASADAAAEAL